MSIEEKLKKDDRDIFLLKTEHPVAYFGLGAIKKLDDIIKDLKNKDIDKYMIITDSIILQATRIDNYIKNLFEENDIEYIIYKEVRANPSYEGCDEATKIAKENNVKAFISIGGGSHHDTAKVAAALLKQPNVNTIDFFEKGVKVENAAPIVCINTTHGTGSELNNTAVAQSDGSFKLGKKSPYFYPTYTIEDPELTLTLPKKQTIAVSLDSFHHAFESLTTKIRNPYTADLSSKAIALVSKWLPIVNAEPHNIKARYWLMYSSAIAGGISLDISGAHVTHGLEHPMGAINPKVIHGVGLTAIFPSILKLTYKVFPELLAEVLNPIIPDLKGFSSEADYAAKRIEQWFKDMGCPEKMIDLELTEKDIPNLIKSAKVSGKANFERAPFEITDDLLATIYKESLYHS
ncbi:MAG: iron-containing alcohol dehydrogenase [Caldisphaera sp.]